MFLLFPDTQVYKWYLFHGAFTPTFFGMDQEVQKEENPAVKIKGV